MATSHHERFAAALRALAADAAALEAAAQHTRDYWYDQPYTGRWFDLLADRDHPNHVTANDLAAVTMLSVQVPPRVSIWLLSPEGRDAVSQHLAEVPVEADFWSAPELLDDGGPLWRLWKVLGEAAWPEFDRGNGMGRTITSKLLAAKRPALVPIFDSVVATVLGPVDDYWAAFRYALTDELRLGLAIATGRAPEEVPLLRRIDALVWMIGKDRQ